ncbi:serine hydrolase domain-containing protein [Actinoplanes sp. CA-030573]|uniref:serine hydrolase domain-containing protein n=1 Tax=Actinoplanes sp. CA-030573 TaxID=3239898 RepID=UPI003D944F07
MSTLLPETARALRHRLAIAQTTGRAPSATAAVVRDDDTVWAESHGDGGGPDVQYRIGSLTKTFTTILVLRLRDEGRLALTDRLDDHLPGTAAGDATIAALLGHTAGLRSEPPGPWFERNPAISEILAEDPYAHPPGALFHYSNPGFALIGALVERLRGEPWEQALRDEVLTPLGMSRTTGSATAPHAAGWAVHPWADVLMPEPATDLGPMAPAGQLWSTTADLARFALFLLNGDDRVLRSESLAEMRRPASPPEAARWDMGYGLGTQLLRHENRLLAGHTGSVPGFVATLWVGHDDGVGAVVLANTTAGFPVATLAADLIRVVAEKEPRIPAPWRPLRSVDPDILELAGPWFWGPAPYLLKPLEDGRLELSPLAGGRIRFHPDGAGRWVGQNGYFHGERLTVERDETGAVTHLDVGTFVFTRRPYDPGTVIPGGVDPAGWRAGGAVVP